MNKGLILLAAGGTGGHLFPAEALAHELKARGYAVDLVTDSRAERFAGHFPADAVHTVHSATFASRNPLAVIRTALTLWRGVRSATRLVRQLRPSAVIGFGGYPTVPPLFAASRLGVPTLVHEQNAVMGRANRALASRARAIAGGFLSANGPYAAKIVETGNPVRPAVLEAAKTAYRASQPDDPFRLVVFGGSQGAQFFSEAVPKALALLDVAMTSRLQVTQQARPEDHERVVSTYAGLGIKAEVSPFFGDMAERIGAAHLVISRSGASTVSELSVIGRPALLVPYPHALDHDQTANAAALAASGGAQVMAQSDLTPQQIARILTQAMNEPERMQAMAAAAKGAGRPDAARLLADLVEAIAAGRRVADIKGVPA